MKIVRDYIISELIKINVIRPGNKLNVRVKVILEKYPGLLRSVWDLTNFIPHEAGLVERMHYILQNVIVQPVCSKCKSPLKMRLSGKVRHTFPNFCGSACFSKNLSIIKKREDTNIERYGHKSPGGNADVRAKAKKTNLERYGTINPLTNPDIVAKREATNIKKYGYKNSLSNPEIRAKAEKTNLERYGYKNSLSNPEIRAKAEKTNLERYGVDNPFKLESFQKKARDTTEDLYGMRYAHQNKDIRLKFTQTMLSKYGVEHAHQNEDSRLKFTQTMLSKYGARHALQTQEHKNKAIQTNLTNHGGMLAVQTQETKDRVMQTNLTNHGDVHSSQTHVLPKSLTLLNDKEWLAEQHHSKEITLTQISVGLGVNDVTVGNYFKKHKIEVKNFKRSMGEREVAEFLTSKFPAIEVRCNDRKILGSRTELDIYIPHLKIGIEYNGEYWHNEVKDDIKKQRCKDLGIRLITIWESAEWLVNKEKVKEMLIGMIQ